MARDADAAMAAEVGAERRVHRVGVVGHAGYAGQELLAWLGRHPNVQTRVVADARRPSPAGGVRPAPDRALLAARRLLAQMDPDRSPEPEPIELGDAMADGALDVVFLATPVDTSLELVPGFLAAGCRVVDLSGAFRLASGAAFERWYGRSHPAPELLDETVYGMADLPDPRRRTARLVANPGCHATAAALALRPAARTGLIEPRDLIACDCKSGVTGAGRKPSPQTHFCAAAENHQVYGLMEHRHLPEILSTCGLEEDRVAFSAQLMPVRRGLMATCYLRLAEGATADDLLAAYAKAYDDAPFVYVYPDGAMPNLTSVVGSNRCHIGLAVALRGGRVMIASVIDNLVKGAAGQAIQNMNLMLGLDETVGLRGGGSQ